jgi:NAD-dependent deacetylase
VLTGAGISAESGLATFRDSDGLWEKHRVEDVATPEAFVRDPAFVWRFYNARRKAGAAASPNPGHLALARFERQGKKIIILTQNVDGLHQRAGSSEVVELHGSLWRARCVKCRRVFTDLPAELPILPYCASCQGLLRPDIVWFGEALDPADLGAAAAALQDCDLFLVAGTSAQVQPAASFAFAAVERGVCVIEVNKEPTALSGLVTVSLQGPAGGILPALLAGL